MKSVILLWLAICTSCTGQIVEFKLQNDYLIVAKCSIADRHDLIAIVDTGVTETVIDSKLAKQLSLPTTRDTATIGTRDAPVMAVSIPNVVFGPIHVESLAGIATDLSYLTHQFSVRPDVLLGTDVLRQGTFLIDYRRKQIVFGPIPAMAHTTALLPDARLLLVETLVEGQKLRLQVDSGINGILIYGGRLRGSPILRSLNARSENLVAGVRTQTISIPVIQIGNWRGHQINAAITDEAPDQLTEFDGLLGPTAFGAHRIGFDFENRIVAWE